jgi:outer membrane protein OmpA-like peptidoglycan-associated protein
MLNIPGGELPMPLRSLRSFTLLLVTALALVVMAPLAQAQQDVQPSKVDIFGGYAYADPRGRAGAFRVPSITKGFGLSSTYYFNNNWGFTVDGGGHFDERAHLGTLMVGPQVRFPGYPVTPFVNFLVGWHRLDLAGLGNSNGIGLNTGGGLDLATWTPRLNFRLIEASYQYGHHNYGPGLSTDNSGVRLRTGLVFRLGSFGPPPPPPSASCAATPGEILAGEPVSVTATAANFNPKKTVTYSWSATGVNVSGTAATTNIDTANLQPGTYTVKANLREGKNLAECSASFRVREPRPPVISCSASPSTVRPGESSNISSQASSPDGRSLTYSYTASAGSISGTGPSATLSSAGAEPGPITVTCNVKDDRNMSASNTTSVNVEAPPPPPPPPAAPEASRLNQIAFKANSARVDNAAKAILDDVALRMQRDADAKIVIVGSNDAKEKSKTLPGQRALNAKAYLVKEKGIDPSRIAVRQGAKEGMTAIIWLVPSGATAPTDGTTEVAEPKKR